MPHGSKPSQPFGAEATGKLRSLVGGIGHEVIVMPIEKDRYVHTVAEVFVKKTNSQEETFVNGELVRLLLHKITFENVLLQSTSTDMPNSLSLARTNSRQSQTLMVPVM